MRARFLACNFRVADILSRNPFGGGIPSVSPTSSAAEVEAYVERF